jgi:hypothetical protein
VGPFERVKVLFFLLSSLVIRLYRQKTSMGGELPYSDSKHFRSCTMNDIGGGSLTDGSDLLCGWDLILR